MRPIPKDGAAPQALLVHVLPAHRLALEPHQVEAQGARWAEWLVQVHRDPALGPVAHRAGELVEGGELRRLGDLVDDAAGGAAAEENRGGALQDLDRLQVEGVAAVLAEVAYPVDVDVVARRESAQREVVTLPAAALARGEADAGHGSERVAEGEERPLLEDLLGEDGDRLGGVLDRVGQLVEARLLDLELVAPPPDVHAGQRDVVLAARRFGGRRLPPGGSGGEGQTHADGGADEPRERHPASTAALDVPDE